MSGHISKMLSFRFYGRFAHFRKFYTNSSSLSYLVPPRTVIIGTLASILECPRDSYYNLFKPDDIKISVSVAPGTNIKRQMQSLNYTHDSYHNLLNKGSVKPKSMHTQCKLELLLPAETYINYTVYVSAMNMESVAVINKIENKITDRDFGFGVYFGQRQFKAEIDDLRVFHDIQFMESSQYIDSICLQENAELSPDQNVESHIIIDQMPVHMQKLETILAKDSDKKTQKTQKTKKQKSNNSENGRKLHTIKRVIYEKSGKRLFGCFRNCYQVGDRVISFYEN